MRISLRNSSGLLSVLLFAGVCSADTIYLKTGAKVNAAVIERTEEYIRADVNGVPVTYYLDEVARVRIKSVPKEVPANAERRSGLPARDKYSPGSSAESPSSSPSPDQEPAP